jgi:hypothetical protein
MQPSWRDYTWKPGNAWFGLAHRVTWTLAGNKTRTHRALFPAWGLIGGVFAGLAALLGLVWACGSTALWYHYSRNLGYASVTWGDIAFPWRWEERREKQGRALLARVEGLFAERKFREGLFALQAGLQLAPGDLKARRTFAALQFRFSREDVATRLLAEGLPYAAADADYATLAVEANLTAQEFDRVLTLAQLWLSTEGRATAADPAFRAAQAQALGYLGRTEEALAVLESGPLASEPLRWLLRAQVQWVNRRPDAAIALLEGGLAALPEDDSLRLRLVQYANASGRPELAERTLQARITTEPRNAARVLDLLRWYADNGRTAAFERGLSLHLQRAAGSEPTLLAVAKLLARLGRVSDIDALPESLAASTTAAPMLGLARIDALIVARRFEEARSDLAQWRTRWLEQLPNHAIDVQVADALTLLALAQTGEAEVALAKVLSGEQLGPRGLLAVAERFTAIGHPATALRVLQRGLELAPTDSGLLRTSALTAVGAGDWNEFSELLTRILARRHTDPALLADLAAHLHSDRSLFVPGRATLLERLEPAQR